MKIEFPNAFQNLLKDVGKQLNEQLYLKLECIRNSEIESVATQNDKSPGKNVLRSMVTSHFMGGLQREMKSSFLNTDQSSETTP
jgi:hypothetical protein